MGGKGREKGERMKGEGKGREGREKEGKEVIASVRKNSGYGLLISNAVVLMLCSC